MLQIFVLYPFWVLGDDICPCILNIWYIYTDTYELDNSKPNKNQLQVTFLKYMILPSKFT